MQIAVVCRQRAADGIHVLPVIIVVDWIGFGLADYAAIRDVGRLAKPNLLQFSRSQRDQVGILHCPELVAFKAEIFQAVAAIVLIWTLILVPGFLILDH